MALNFALLLLFTFVGSVVSHGNLLRPLNRASIWRNPDFAHLNPRENWNDRELYCGGFTKQYFVNGGLCGPCGDDWAEAVPRLHENTGWFGQGIITATYSSGQAIPIEVYLEAHHMGYFEFSICSLPSANSVETETCFQYKLQQDNGAGEKFYPNNGIGNYVMNYRLPQGLRCPRCVLRWHYRTGNGYGDCGDGTSDYGCGDQEIFRGCSDISIV